MSNLKKPNKPAKSTGKDKVADPKPAPKIELVRIIPKAPDKPPDPLPAEAPIDLPNAETKLAPANFSPKATSKAIAKIAIETNKNQPQATVEIPQVADKPLETAEPSGEPKAKVEAKKDKKVADKLADQLETTELTAQEAIPKPPCVHPISPATEPMQYRAIGLVQGRFVPEEEEENKGSLLTADGAVISAVILGKMMSLIKRKLDIAREYLWVVYPRTQPQTGDLHVQITGVWAPLELSKPHQDLELSIEEGKFSVRGEVVHINPEANTIVVKIKRTDAKALTNQALRKFKLQIIGSLPEDATNHFWDLIVMRQGTSLHLVDGTSIAVVPKKPFMKNRGKPRSRIETGSTEEIRPPKRPVKIEKPHPVKPSTIRPQ